jgi:hypothetical protein
VCKSESVCLRACRLTYPEYHAQSPCCLRLLWLHHIFRHRLTKGKIFGGKKRVTQCEMCVLIFSKALHERIQLDIVINVKTSSCKVPVIHVGF